MNPAMPRQRAGFGVRTSMRPRVPVLLSLVFALVGVVLAPAADAAGPRVIKDVNYNQDEFAPPQSIYNSLDLYLPDDASPRSGRLRPVVVWVHGGAWMTGDKSNKMTHKARLFNDLGYIVASVNYQLSPDISGDWDGQFPPLRVRSPDHVADVAESIAWLTVNIQRHGGDPDRIVLAGHSAGAHLVSLVATNPSFLKGRFLFVPGRRVSPKQVVGVVALDTDAFDIRQEADASNPFNGPQRLALIWNAFGTPEEEAAHARWEAASPILHADASDPRFLLVTQSNRALRMMSNRAMATALGQDPDETVLGVPLDHAGINDVLGDPSDPTAETSRVREFVLDAVGSASPAGVRMVRRPPKRVVVGVPRHRRKAPRRKVTFAFRGTGRATGFQCRIDRGRYAACRSSKSYRLKPGSHTFRVRPLYPSGRPGDERKATFRIVARRGRR